MSKLKLWQHLFNIRKYFRQKKRKIAKLNAKLNDYVTFHVNAFRFQKGQTFNFNQLYHHIYNYQFLIMTAQEAIANKLGEFLTK